MNGSAGSAGRRLTGEAETVATTTRAELVHDGDTLRLLMANGGKGFDFQRAPKWGARIGRHGRMSPSRAWDGGGADQSGRGTRIELTVSL